MGQIDAKSNVGHAILHAYAQKNATASIQGTDVSDFMGATFVITVGAHTADGMSITLQESDDNSAWTDIATSQMDGTTGWSQDLSITSSNDATTYYVGYSGNKKYIGAVLTDAGSGDVIMGVHVIKVTPRYIPQNG